MMKLKVLSVCLKVGDAGIRLEMCTRKNAEEYKYSY